MMDAPTPPPWLVSLLAERTAPMTLDLQRNALLGPGAQTARIPASEAQGPLKQAQGAMEAFYAKGTAESVETMVGLIDAIPDPQWHLKAITTLRLLVMQARGEGEFGSPSPVAEIEAANARSGNSKRVEERRERLRPHVTRMVDANPCAGPAKIAALLGTKKAS